MATLTRTVALGGAVGVTEQSDRPRMVTFRDVLRVAEFRVLWVAELQSAAGDELARVALAVLVFARTGSAGLTAVTYALTYLPDLVGGPLLSGLADRFPRRRVMVTSDVARAALVGLMALPGTPLWLLVGLLVAVQLCNAPFFAAQGAMLPVVLPADHLVAGQTLRQTSRRPGRLRGRWGSGRAAGFVAGTGHERGDFRRVRRIAAVRDTTPTSPRCWHRGRSDVLRPSPRRRRAADLGGPPVAQPGGTGLAGGLLHRPGRCGGAAGGAIGSGADRGRPATRGQPGRVRGRRSGHRPVGAVSVPAAPAGATGGGEHRGSRALRVSSPLCPSRWA